MQINNHRPHELLALEIDRSISKLTNKENCDRRKLHTYRLKFVPLEGECPKDIEFQAADEHRAFRIIQKTAKNGSTELWRNGCKLCSVSLRKDGVWEVRTQQ